MSEWDDLNNQIISCRLCPRLVEWRERVAAQRKRAYREWEYWGRPVPGFGDHKARLLIVGLAPGAHGANRTGRMFTGDGSGEFLYRALHKTQFASQPSSHHLGDSLELFGVYISAVCRCAPPENKPQPTEIQACLPFLIREMELLQDVEGIVALGRVAFENILRIYRGQGKTIPPLNFHHGAMYNLATDLPWLLASYHPSRQNTQTGRLTVAMFDHIWETARKYLWRG